MRLIEKTPMGEPLYECDDCRIVGREDSVILLEENGGHLCFSCWYERNCRRPRKEKTALVEI